LVPRITIVQRYLVGLGATFAGAAGTEFSGSMLPLALGASLTLICTVDVIRRILARARARGH
jgi:hypothetical protein